MLRSLIALGAGFASWPVYEYVLHRFVYHGPDENNPGTSPHVRHHRYPAEANDFTLIESWQESAGFAPHHTLALLAGLTPLTGFSNAAAYVAGVWLGVGLYEVEHLRAHNQGPKTEHQKRIIKHHLDHHFRHPNANFGVNTTVFDKLLGTYESTEGPVPVPAHMAPRWLKENPGAWAADYKIMGLARQTHKKKSA